jgi:hypothetical protein
MASRVCHNTHATHKTQQSLSLGTNGDLVRGGGGYLEEMFLEAELKNVDGEDGRREIEEVIDQRQRTAGNGRRSSHVREEQIERDYETLQQIVLDLALCGRRSE